MSPTPSPSELKAALLDQAAALGLDAVGVAPVEVELRRDYYLRWIAQGRHGEMAWMERNNERRLEPANALPGARSIVCAGMNYFQPRPPRRGRIATYALGGDYHKVLLQRLKRLCEWLREQGAENRPYVDTGPALEKALGARAGLGWQGKHTNLIHPRLGNWLFLGVIHTTLELTPDEPARDRCGTCSRCMDACPTGAITAPYQLDARLCISYLTIEHKGPIPPHLRPLIGEHLYGCDDCLDACPWNRWAQLTREARFAPRPVPDLRVMLAWTEDDFAAAFAGSPIKRIGLARWLRNVCVVLGNTGTPDDLPALRQAAKHTDPLVAEHAAWAVDTLCAKHRLQEGGASTE